MKIIVTLVIGIIACILAQLFIPIWWVFVIVTFATSYFSPNKTSLRSFFFGLIIVTITWLSLYLFKDYANTGIMSDKMAALFSMKSNYWLFAIVSLVMGILGGFTPMAAWFIKKK
jgi:hypothetical protein